MDAVKILVLGGGQVGANVAENLAAIDQNDVTVVDIDEEALKKMSEKLDILLKISSSFLENILDF